MPLRILSLIIVCLFSTLSLHAQNQEWFTYTDGRPVSQVREHNGTFWVSTYGGLVYFKNPAEVYHLDQSNSPINTHKFSAMDMDANGGLWLGTTGGDIYSYINGEWTFYSDEASREHSVLRVSEIIVDQNNEVWFTRRYMDPPKEKPKKAGITARAYGEDYELIKIEGSSFKRQKVKATTVYDMSLGKDNSLLLATNEGVKRFDGKSKEVKAPEDLIADQPFKVFQDAKGMYWLSSGRNTWMREESGSWLVQEIYEAEGKKFTIPAESFYTGKEGQQIIGASGEIFTQQEDGWKRFDRESLKAQFGRNVNMDDVFVTQNGNLFANTRVGLLWIKDDEVIAINTSNSALQGSNIQHVYIDHEDVIHCKSDGMAFKIRKGEWTSEYLNNQSWSPIFRSLSEADRNRLDDFIRNQLKTYFSQIIKSRDGNIWIATSKGLVQFKDGVIQVYKPSNSDLPSSSIMTIAQAPNDALWIGLDSGVVEWKDESMTYHMLESRYHGAKHSTIAFGQEGEVYVGGIDGFHIYNGNGWKHIEEGLPRNKTINDMVVDMNGTLWLATYGSGLLRYDGERLKNITTEGTGLSNNTIFSLDVDQYNNIWLATYEGLCVHNESGLVGQAAKDGSSPYYQVQFNSPYSVKTDVKDENTSVLNLEFKKTKDLFTQLKLFPNPTSGSFTIQLESSDGGEVEYLLLDINGRLIQTKKMTGQRQEVNMDISTHAAGLYLLRIRKGSTIVSERIIKR